MSVSLSELSSFRTIATAKSIFHLNRKDDLNELANQLSTTPSWLVLGEGSNVLFVGDYSGMVIINRLKGIDINPYHVAATETIDIIAAAGENWNQFVLGMSQLGYYGLENLALIPGSVGAAPVQNIGAYGVEVAEFIKSVTVFDLKTQTIEEIAADDCGFTYRNSHFKSDDWRQRYIITDVTFTLSRTFNPVLTYQGLNAPQDNASPMTAEKCIERVISVRKSKLPDPKVLPNAGSFFKNPVVSLTQLQRLQNDYYDIPHFPLAADTAKIPAAWLLQNCGFKGTKKPSGAGVYEHHALILVNHGGASGEDIWGLANEMITAVHEKFSITLSPEVRIINSLTG